MTTLELGEKNWYAGLSVWYLKFLGKENLYKHYLHTLHLLYPKSILYAHISIHTAINIQHQYLEHTYSIPTYCTITYYIPTYYTPSYNI